MTELSNPPRYTQAAQLGARMVESWYTGHVMGHPLGDAEHFLKLALSPSVHAWLVESGWPGSDGSSASLDNIEGIRIGATGTAFNRLPATVHDRGYELSRRYGGLPAPLRKRMDRAYRDLCIRAVSEVLVGWNHRKAVARAHARYLGLRVGAWRAWKR